jgi:hypothetical protein
MEDSVVININDPEKQRDKLLRAYRRQKICRQFLVRQTILNSEDESVQLTPSVGGKKLSRSNKDEFSPQVDVLSIDEENEPSEPTPREVRRIYNENTRIIDDAKNNHDLDEVVDQTIDSLCLNAAKQARYNYVKSIGFKSLDIAIYLIVTGLTVTIASLSLRNSTYNSEGTDSKDFQDIFFLIGILTIANGAINEMRERFPLKERSKILRKCYHQLREKEQELRFLRFSSEDPLSILDKLEKIERQMDSIDMLAFDSQIISTGNRESIFRSRIKTHQNVRPEDIPISPRSKDNDKSED